MPDIRPFSCRPLAPLVLFVTLLALAFAGCVANDENAMPWAAPDPRDGSINLPGAFSRP